MNSKNTNDYFLTSLVTTKWTSGTRRKILQKFKGGGTKISEQM